MPRCGDASGALPDGERLAGVRALCDDQYRTVCFLGGHRELAAVSWRPEACVLLDDWRFFRLKNEWRICMRLREGTC